MVLGTLFRVFGQPTLHALYPFPPLLMLTPIPAPKYPASQKNPGNPRQHDFHA